MVNKLIFITYFTACPMAIAEISERKSDFNVVCQSSACRKTGMWTGPQHVEIVAEPVGQKKAALH